MSNKEIDTAPEPKVATTRIVNRFTFATVGADTATAFVVSGICAIPISIIDLSIMSKVAGVSATMGEGLKTGTKTLFTDPYHFFIKDHPGRHTALVYRICFAVYFSTYLAANVTRTWCEASGDSKERTAVMAGLSSSAINTGMTVWKDSVILRSLPLAVGAAAGAAYVPVLSRMGFAFRDTLTCIAAFTITPLLRDNFISKGWSVDTAKTTASLVTPMSMQLITTVVHIPSIVYQRKYDKNRSWGGPEGYTAAIVKQMKLDYVDALRLRALRIFLAFGVSTLVATDLRLALATKWGGTEAISRI